MGWQRVRRAGGWRRVPAPAKILPQFRNGWPGRARPLSIIRFQARAEDRAGNGWAAPVRQSVVAGTVRFRHTDNGASASDRASRRWRRYRFGAMAAHYRIVPVPETRGFPLAALYCP